ncbi:MAG: prolyl oligopeptidase family serine peptidase [Gemmataceae bacterium]
MNRLALPLLCVIGVAMHPEPGAAAGRPMTVADLYKFKRVSDAQISPDGKWVVYVVAAVDLAGNKSSSNLWLAPAAGGEPRQLTTTDKKDRHPRWSPDGKRILFESTRGGDQQLWVIDLAGGEARQVTHVSSEASGGVWSPDGSHIAFVSAVYPEFSEKPFKESNEANKKKSEEISKSPVKAKVFKRLFYRHWDSWVEDKRQHLFVQQVAYRQVDSPKSADGLPKWEPRDVTPGDRDANPTSTTFETGDNFTSSPDGQFLVFTAVPEKGEAWSTNHDICRVSIHNSSPKWEALTGDNLAADSGPVFSPDGKKLAYRAQKKAGYEADKWDLMIVDCDASGKLTGKPKAITAGLDRSVDDYIWGPDNATLFFTAEENAGKPIWEIHSGTGSVSKLVTGGQNNSISVSANGERLAFTNAALDHPPRVAVTATQRGASEKPHVIDPNAGLLAELAMQRPESAEVPVEGGGKMQMWILKPPGFDPQKKWPVAFLVHGGPQGAWEDGWSYRWCPELWAAQGYVVALPNPRGSTGFGQKFVDEISGDWGGKCFRDLMAGADYVEKLDYVDKDRIGAAGASFGGYMMDWFAVSTPRFKCLISHCSVWNFESMWGTTDELWFDEYEHGGLPWEFPGKYREYSPHTKAANLGKYRTPMLLIQNDLDFRCPVGQGIELFSALQRQGVKSKFINFPDEGHWVLKPANSEYWHKEVFAWLKEHVPPGGK